MATNTAINPAMVSVVGMETGAGSADVVRRFAPNQVALGVDGSVWAYGYNGTGSSLAAGAVNVDQTTISGTNSLVSGTGYTIDKAVPSTYWYWARKAEGGIGPQADYVVTLAIAAGAANKLRVTLTVKDSAGNAVAGVTTLRLYFSDSATGAGLTSASFSGTLAAVSTFGTILSTPTSAKEFIVQTNASGVFKGDLTDTNKVATVYAVAANPTNGGLSVSAVSGTNWG